MINQLPIDIQLYYKWRVRDLPLETKLLLDKVLTAYCQSIPQIIIVLNIIGGINYSKFKKYAADNQGNIPDKIDFNSIPDLNIALNPDQVKAILHDTSERPLLILAGAGSGKTAVLTRRIVFLIMLGIPIESIIAVTFTNKAAEEMKTRVINLAERVTDGIEDINYLSFTKNILSQIDNIRLGTFHSICYDIIIENVDNIPNYKRLNYTVPPTILDVIKQQDILKRLIEKHNLKSYGIMDVLEELGNAKSELILPENFMKDGTSKKIKKSVFNKFYADYQKYLIERNFVDFDDIIMKVVILMTDFKEVISLYQEKFQYFLIDEYQDTNFAQYVMAIKFVEKHKNIFAVGDDDQSIYGWRGADFRNILNFKKDFENAEIIKFEKNYRSSSNILDAANAVFEDKEKSMRKTLECAGKTDGIGEKIILFEALNEKDEARFCAFEIKRYAENYSKNSIANLKILLNQYGEELYNNLIIAKQNYESIPDSTVKGWKKLTDFINNYSHLIENETIHNYEKLFSSFQDIQFALYEDISDNEKVVFTNLIESILHIIKSFGSYLYIYNNFAIFYRINSQKQIFKEILDNEDIPYVEIGDNQFFHNREVINIITMFELMNGIMKYKNNELKRLNINNEINIPLISILKIPVFGFSKREIELFETMSPSESILSSKELDYVYKNISSAAKGSFHYLIEEIKKLIENMNQYNSIKFCYEFMRILEYDKKILRNDVDSRLVKDNLNRLKSICYEFEKINKTMGAGNLERFIKFIKYKQSDVQGQVLIQDGVFLMTLHSAKGLEFPVVFFTGLEEGVCPFMFRNKSIDKNELDEERRLFYVGITRAEKILFLTYCNYRDWFGKITSMKKSRFLNSIPSNLLDKGSSVTGLSKIILIIKKIINKFFK